MRTHFINDVFFKNIESESQGRIKIEPHWGGSIAKAHDELQAIADHKTDLIVAVPNTACNNCRCTNCSKAS